MCKCGYLRNLHVPGSDAEEWRTLDNTKTDPTDAFGEVQFAGSTMKARKVRISSGYFLIFIVVADEWLAVEHLDHITSTSVYTT